MLCECLHTIYYFVLLFVNSALFLRSIQVGVWIWFMTCIVQCKHFILAVLLFQIFVINNAAMNILVLVFSASMNDSF